MAFEKRAFDRRRSNEVAVVGYQRIEKSIIVEVCEDRAPPAVWRKTLGFQSPSAAAAAAGLHKL